MNKNIIMPILTGLALILKKAVGYEIGTEEIDVLADMILGIVTLAGVFMTPKVQK